MSKFDTYRVKFTAIITGWANYAIPEGEKIGHFVDEGADIEWDLSTVRDIEAHDHEYEGGYDDGDCEDGCEVEDADGPDARAPYPQTDDDTAPDNDDGFPF
jgi:hypothetical protein